MGCRDHVVNSHSDCVMWTFYVQWIVAYITAWQRPYSMFFAAVSDRASQHFNKYGMSLTACIILTVVHALGVICWTCACSRSSTSLSDSFSQRGVLSAHHSTSQRSSLVACPGADPVPPVCPYVALSQRYNIVVSRWEHSPNYRRATWPSSRFIGYNTHCLNDQLWATAHLPSTIHERGTVCQHPFCTLMTDHLTLTLSLLHLRIVAVSSKLSLNYSIANLHHSYLPLRDLLLLLTAAILSLRKRLTNSVFPCSCCFHW